MVQGHFHQSAGAVSLTLGAYGAGSMAAALLLPRTLRRLSDRAAMLPGAFVLQLILAAVAVATAIGPSGCSWAALLASWAAIGATCSAVLTPGGRFVRLSACDADLPAAFAAQFSLSHSCRLLTYPLADWLAPASLSPPPSSASSR